MEKHIPIDEGIIGNGTAFVDTESEDFKMLQKAILEYSKNRTPQQKLETNLISLRLQMEDYLQENDPKQLLNIGYFLKEILKEMKIKNNAFAEYIGLTKTNFSALIHGKRKLNPDLAIKFGQIFKISPDIWINIESKNQLLEIKKENKDKYKKYKPENLLTLK